MLTIWIILILLGIVGWLIYLFNTLVGLSNHTDAAWAEIDALLSRRYDLLAKLIELATTSGLAGSAVEELAAARAAGLEAYSPEEKAHTEPAVVDALQGLLGLAAANTQLKSNTDFVQLEHTLSDIEDYLRGARRQYNALVDELNTQVARRHNNLVASWFGVHPREHFGSDTGKTLSPPKPG